MRKHPVAVAIAFVVLAFVFLDLVNAPVEGQSGADDDGGRAERQGRTGCLWCVRRRAMAEAAVDAARPRNVDVGRGAVRLRREPEPRLRPPARRAAGDQAAAGTPIRLPQIGPSIEFPMFRLPLRDATTAQPPGGAVRTRRQDARRRSRRRQAGRRLSLGAHRHGMGRAGESHRGLDSVGQDVPPPAR